jgi:hypothetical protein
MLNEEQRKPRVWLFVGIVFGMCCLAYGSLYLISTMPDPDAVGECRAIAKSVESTVSLPPSVSTPNAAALFCDREVRGVFLRSFDHIRVYGVVDRKGQDVVTASVISSRQRLKTKPIVLDFYEKENWKTWSDAATGRSGGDRGPEAAIRRVVIK